MRKKNSLIRILFVIINIINVINCLNYNSSIFYYPWYGNPSSDGSWFHWQQNNHSPPDDIGSNYYPLIGAYSSRNVTTLNQHMIWISSSNIGVIVISWWGRNSREDSLIPYILDAANNYEIKVSFHIEPYSGRTANTVKNDIEYIYQTYGNHQAFFKQNRSTKWGTSSLSRGVFYIFDSLKIDDNSWLQMLDSIRSTSIDAIVLGQTTDVSRIDRCHFDGLYTYDAFRIDGSIFKDISDGIKAKNSIFSASIGPGYIDVRADAGSNRNKSRHNEDTYDSMWKYAINAQVEWISITSFNEWHEGSQIEPAINKSIPQYQYMNYQEAYGYTPDQAPYAYLNRTKYWIHLYQLH
jgi:hypothetical protein